MIVKWVLRYHKETDKRVFFFFTAHDHRFQNGKASFLHAAQEHKRHELCTV